MYLNEPYILSGYSCFYKNQDNSINISSAALENLGNMRKKYKKQMEAAEHGSDEYIYYRILQLTYKVLMNSYYGILGEKNSLFYNPYVQNSITMTGQDLITTSIISMENFLSNNVLFECTDDVLTFINNIKEETKSYQILNYLDEVIGKEELLNYFLSHKKEDAVLDAEIIRSEIAPLDPEIVCRCYYKNQILELIKNNLWFTDKLKEILKYKYTDKQDPEMIPLLDDFRGKIIDFCFYDYLYEDRYKRAMKDMRKSIITIDTDSNFINGNKYVVAITEMFNLDKTNKDEQGTIINIIIDITTEALKRTFWTLTTNMGLVERAKPIINMKQESIGSIIQRCIIQNSLNCWNRKKSAAKPRNRNVQRLSKTYFRRNI